MVAIVALSVKVAALVEIADVRMLAAALPAVPMQVGAAGHAVVKFSVHATGLDEPSEIAPRTAFPTTLGDPPPHDDTVTAERLIGMSWNAASLDPTRPRTKPQMNHANCLDIFKEDSKWFRCKSCTLPDSS